MKHSQYLTLREAVEVVPVSQITLRRAIAAGELIAYKIGGKLLICPEDLEAWIQSRRVVPSGPMPQPRRKGTSLLETVLEDD